MLVPTDSPAEPSPDNGGGIGGIGRASRAMALGTIASRVTGFLRSLALVYVLGLQLVPAAYHAANTLPNMVYELLLGGILTSVFIPLIIKAQRQDADGGAAYTQRLLSLIVVLLVVGTVLAVLAVPLLVSLQGFESGAQRDLAVTLARLLLPEILFYGISAGLVAVLNSRGHFGTPMWAPVGNNIVVITTCAVFLTLPGPAQVTPETITTMQVLVLGIGTTLGIVVQAAILLPALRRVGFRWRWRFDIRNARLGETARLAGWMIAYVVISQVGVIVIQRLAVLVERAHPAAPGLGVLINAQLLFMVPYGIVAVSLITALLPRMSRAAVDGQPREVARDLSLGTRLVSVLLLPVTAAFVALGPAIGTLLYSHGRSSTDDGRDVGLALAAGALGLLPFAVSHLQIFAFYALRDTRTPALVNLAVVGSKVAVDLLLYAVLPPEHVISGLMWGNTVSYLVAVIVTGMLLSRRLGGLETRRVLRTVGRLTLAAAVGGLLAFAVLLGLDSRLGNEVVTAAAVLIVGSILGGAAYLAVAVRLDVAEVGEVVGELRGRLNR